jgi:hypothetical protein
MQLGDALSSFLRNSTEQEAQAQHSGIIQGISIMRDLCDHIHDLVMWGYNTEQMELVKSRFKILSGWGRQLRVQQIETAALPLIRMGDSSGAAAPKPELLSNRQQLRLRQALEPRRLHQPGREGGEQQEENRMVAKRQDGDIVETPFLLAFLFALHSPDMPLLPLAHFLAKASKGHWNEARTVFTVERERRSRAGAREWLLETEHMPSFGVATVFFIDASIQKFVFPRPWPLTQVHSGPKFLPPACRIPVMTRRPFAPRRNLLELSGRDASYLSMALVDWEAVMGSLAAELRIVLEGRFAISRAELPLVQVVYKNHPSWENNLEARTALWPVLAQYLVLGQFEYVLEGDPLPMAILPIGAVPKSTFPWWRLILDCRYSNKFIDPWPLRYLSLQTLSLLLSRTVSSQWQT